MKIFLYVLLLFSVIIAAIFIGFGAATLVSAPNTILVIAGFFVAFLNVLGAFYFSQKIFHKLIMLSEK